MLREGNWRAPAASVVGVALVTVCATAHAQEKPYAVPDAYINETPTSAALDLPDAMSATAPQVTFNLGVGATALADASSAAVADPTSSRPTGSALSDAPAPLAFSLNRSSASPSAVYAEWRMTRETRLCADSACGDAEPSNNDAFLLRVGADDFGMRVGAQARFAERISSLVSEGGRSRWYFFFAADAEALTWTPGKRQQEHQGGSLFTLGDMQLIGDAQAGIGARIGGADVAIGYVGREVSHLGAERQENFLGLTYSWSG